MKNNTTVCSLKTLKKNIYIICIFLLLYTAGCNNTPNIRRGSLATTTLGIPFLHPKPIFLDPNNLGKHSYFPNPFEKNGIVYTCDGGHIDIAHVRANADDTRYLVGKIYETLMKGKSRLSFGLAFEQSHHIVDFTYPDNWDDLTEEQKQQTARELSLTAGAYITFNATLWHEFMSWFGVRFAIIDPQFNSAFSWEDVYSNILGVNIGIEALKDKEHSYNQAVTDAINNQLKRLKVQPRQTAIELTENMRDKWFKGNRIPDMLRRNTDIGTDDGYIAPVLVPDGCEDAQPSLIAAPSPETLVSDGFSITYRIKPVYFEAGKVLKIIEPDGKAKLVEPARDYPLIIDFINKEATEKHHYDVSSIEAN